MMKAFDIAAAVKSGTLKAERAVTESLAAIEAGNGEIGAFLEVFKDSALESARRLDADIAKGKKPGRMAGVPVALKDNILYEGHAATCASKLLAGHKAVYSATVTAKLLAEDAIIVGRTNMDEFAMGSSCENSAYLKTRNPADVTRVPGGSSGGSAAAVAAGMVPVALGSDTGGSIRQPAAFCGVAGLKPTYGSVSRYGLVAFASSLDQIGPFASDVRDAALAFSVISGHDRMDSTSVDGGSAPDAAALNGDVRGMKVGLPKEFFVGGLDRGVEELVRSAAKRLEAGGAVLKEVSLPNSRFALPTYYILASSEASSNLARFDGIRYGYSVARGDDENKLGLSDVYELSRGAGFGPEVKRRIMLGTYALSSGYYDAYYARAQKVRTLICRDFEKAFSDVDVILTPTAPTEAFRFGEKMEDPVSMYLSDIYTIPCNMAGIPGMSVPCGKTASGLPAGVQLMSKLFGEEAVFNACIAAAEWN